MARQALAAVVLAAGRGERMRSSMPKALHEVAGRPMVAHVVDTLGGLAPERIVCVTGPGMDEVAAAAAPAEAVLQAEQRGTAHAVMAARGALGGFEGAVLVLFADTPLIRAETMQALGDAVDGGAAVAVLGMRPADANEYGRVALDGAAGRKRSWNGATPDRRSAPCRSAMRASWRWTAAGSSRCSTGWAMTMPGASST